MKLIRNIIDKLYETKSLKIFTPIFDALDSFFFQVNDVADGAPHILDNLEIKRYMSFVIIALLPGVFASIYFYGLKAIYMIAVSYIVGGAVEVAFAILRKKEICEGFLVTGLIFPLTLPPTVPLWVVAVGVFVGVFFGKEVFGGTGRNIFNPALVGRLFVTIAFPSIMTSFRDPITHALTTATPLTIYKNAGEITGIVTLLNGHAAGSMGETFRLGLLAGGIFLIFTKVSNWRIPLTYLGTVFLFSFIGHSINPDLIAPPVFQLLTGGLILGAFFMATDPVSTTFTYPGKYIFGLGCGVLTVLIRTFSGFTEGVMFSIVLMNSFAPFIDQFILKINYKKVANV